MNFGQAFTYIFQDADWLKKIGLVALVQLIPILGQIVAMGFMIEIIRRIIANDPRPLPEFDFGGFLGKGFQAFVVALVYAIPTIILTLPLQIMPMLIGAIDNPDVYNTMSLAISCLCGGLSFLYGIFLAFILPAAFGRIAATGNIGSAFRIGEIIAQVRRALVPYLIAVLGTMLAGLIVPFGLIACGIGVFLTVTYYNAVSAHLFGQAYRQAVPI
jgi:hypothetical protein